MSSTSFHGRNVYTEVWIKGPEGDGGAERGNVKQQTATAYTGGARIRQFLKFSNVGATTLHGYPT